ncbi:hypothetical protein LTR49_001925 [Elasticomyces elasticus]|nr:hypothetical protein LTR49_001925 [Elasticomyces elasticus]
MTMSSALLPVMLRSAVTSSTPRTFSTTSHSRASVLFALNALSNSRETQHFNKLSNLNRVKHSPPLKLIQSSEVDPFSPSALPPKAASIPLARTAQSSARAWDDKALRVGRAVLAENARQLGRLQQALRRSKAREARQVRLAQVDKAAWHQEVRRHHQEMRAAGMWILLSIGTATALATWRFWPQQKQIDSGELSRRLAATAQRSMALPRAASSDVAVSAGSGVAAAEMQALATPASVVEPVLVSSASMLPVAEVKTPSSSWFKSMFWKQQ